MRFPEVITTALTPPLLLPLLRRRLNGGRDAAHEREAAKQQLPERW
jgi:hypothetical protein